MCDLLLKLLLQVNCQKNDDLLDFLEKMTKINVF